MWRFQDFCIIQILREINFEDSWSVKSAILPHLKALNFNFYEFLHFLKDEIYQRNKLRRPKMAKTVVFALLESKKLISRKILHEMCSEKQFFSSSQFRVKFFSKRNRFDEIFATKLWQLNSTISLIWRANQLLL